MFVFLQESIRSLIYPLSVIRVLSKSTLTFTMADLKQVRAYAFSIYSSLFKIFITYIYARIAQPRHKTNSNQFQRDLITANHIIHYHGVVDAYGHISVRHPNQPDTYLMSAEMAPALVSSPADFVQYRIEDSTPYNNENAPRGFIERYIHSEIYKRYPGVQCVVHSHAEAVLPYAISGVPLQPVYHMGGFLGRFCSEWKNTCVKADRSRK